MFFDGASRIGAKGQIVAKVGVVFVPPQNNVLPHVFSLMEPCFNNMIEYNALLISLHLARQMGIQYLEACDDYKLIVNQIKK